jgi:hypothetical protein
MCNFILHHAYLSPSRNFSQSSLQCEVVSDEKPIFHVSEDYKLPRLFQKNTTDPIHISDRLKELQNLGELKSQ